MAASDRVSGLPVIRVKATTQVEPCPWWPLGECRFGLACKRIHHDNLNPNLRAQREHQEYMVPNEVGQACVRCLATARECDKLGRDEDHDDPCSECRWFGGEFCECQIAVDTSYNDQLWSNMITAKDRDYRLGPPKNREVGNPRKPPTPMPGSKVRPDWQGETREQLLAKPEMLPDFVRRLPRAYLVPPRTSSRHKKFAAYQVVQSKRKREDDHSSSSPSSIVGARAGSAAPSPFAAAPILPQQLLRPGISSRPPPIPQFGKVMFSEIDWDTGEVRHTYESGHVVTDPMPTSAFAVPR